MPNAPDSRTSPLAEQFAAAMSDLTHIEQLSIAYSGGVDSTALLLLSAEWARQHGVAVLAIHANHGLQQQARVWEQHCAEVCRAIPVDFISAALDLPATGNLEASAREARYQLFKRHTGEGGWLAVAHHAADQSETALLRLLQGRGLLAMQPRSRVDGLAVVRPLLQHTKDELQAYVVSQGVTWIEDQSNQDLRMDRNFLRHQIMPALYERWPQLDRSITRVLGHQSTVERTFKRLLRSRLVERSSAEGRTLALPVSLLETDVDESLVVLRALLELAEVYTVTDKSLREFIDQCGRGDQARLGAAHWTLTRQADEVCLTRH